jgi:ABC-2 type transport system permease protein
MILIGFFSILLLSNVITALSSFFLARDLDLLVAAPVDWLKLYGREAAGDRRQLELDGRAAGGADVRRVRLGVSRRMAVPAARDRRVRAVPRRAGGDRERTHAHPGERVPGAAHARHPQRHRVLAAGGIVLLFRIVRPERLARPEGFRSLVEFVTVLRTPTSPFLPSEWVQRAVLSWLQERPSLLPVYLLWTTAAAAFVLGALLHWKLYPIGFSKAQESGERWARGGGFGRLGHKLFSPLGILRRELVLKELRLFFRDTTQWSQLILLTVLVIVYVFNIKYLPLKGEGCTFFLVNVIPS